MEKTGRSRKTVERMLKGLYELGLEPQITNFEEDHHLTKRWTLKGGIPPFILGLDSSERATLELLLTSLNAGPQKRALSKLLALQKPLAKHLAIDTDILIERTAHLGKIGPRNQVNEIVMNTIENGIQGFEEVNLLYRAQGKAKSTWRIVRPLGMLFGRFSYLVASSGNRDPITYRLDLIEKAHLTDKLFTKDKDFNFKEWASESFGVYHGDGVLNITLRFKKQVAKRAEKINFHPSQITKKLKDGSLIVKLNCCGHWELFHELSHPDWLTNIVIEEPSELISEYQVYLKQLQSVIDSTLVN